MPLNVTERTHTQATATGNYLSTRKRLPLEATATLPLKMTAAAKRKRDLNDSGEQRVPGVPAYNS